MVTPGSLLAETYQSETIAVTPFTTRHFAIAPELVVNAVASDEIVESVSRPASAWILGVQWHPEMMFRSHPEHLKPFEALVNRASLRRSNSEGDTQ